MENHRTKCTKKWVPRGRFSKIYYFEENQNLSSTLLQSNLIASVRLLHSARYSAVCFSNFVQIPINSVLHEYKTWKIMILLPASRTFNEFFNVSHLNERALSLSSKNYYIAHVIVQYVYQILLKSLLNGLCPSRI